MSDLNQNPLNNGQPNQTEPMGLQQPVNPAIGGLQQPVNPAVSGQPVQTPVMEQNPQQPDLQPMGGQFTQPVNPAMQQPSVSPEMVQDFNNTMVANGADVVTKKSKKGLFIGIAASLAVLVGGSVAAYSFSPWVKNNVKMLINDPAEYYAWVEEENAKTVAEDVSAAYGSAFDNAKTESEVTLKAELNADSIDKFFEESEGMSISSLGFELPSELSVSVASKYENENLIGSMNVATEDGAVVTANIYFIDGVYYYQIPELSSSYIAMDMDAIMESAYSELDSEMAAFMESYMETAMNMTDPSAVKELVSENDLKDIILNYSAAVYGQIDDVELEKGVSRKVGSVDMEYNVLTAEIDEKCLYDICMEALETAEDDKTVIGICEELGVDKDTYKETLTSLIESLEAEEVDSESKDYVEMNVYVSSTGVICGREFILHEEDVESENPVTVSYICAEDDDKSAFEVEFKVAEDDGFVLSGDMEEKSGKTNGEIAFTVNNTGEVTEIPVTLKDIETAGKNEEYLKGEVTLDLSTVGVPALTFALDSDGKSQTVSTDVVIAGTDFGKISYIISEKASSEIPAFDSSKTVYQFDETGMGLEEYAAEVEANLPTFINKIGDSIGFEGLYDLIFASNELDSGYVEDEYEFVEDEIDFEDVEIEEEFEEIEEEDFEDLEDFEDYDDEILEGTCKFSELKNEFNGTAFTYPAELDGILNYVDVTDEVVEPFDFGSYYDADYTMYVFVENNGETALAPADCTVTGLSVYEGAPVDMKLGGVGIGDSVKALESAFGVTIENTADGSITIYDEDTAWNSLTFYWYDGAVYSMNITVYD